MNYRHAFHAGNFADVVKHVALVAILLHLRRKEQAFCVIDTHAGRGLYDLGGEQAVRSAESGSGIGRLHDLDARADLPDALRTYMNCANGEGQGHYPGSPRIAAQLLRPQDRLIAIEKHPEEFAALQDALSAFSNSRAVLADGQGRLPLLLPPRERRGLILIDPSYEADDEFERAAGLLARAHRRFATGTYLLWFPIKSRVRADAFCGEVRARLAAPMLRIDADIGYDAARDAADRQRLTAAGLLLVNPPFRFEAEMRSACVCLSPLLGRAPDCPAAFTFADV